jgi:dGTPase
MPNHIEYSSLLNPKRFKEERTNTNIKNAFGSDKARVIFSSSFRRLQQKAQVFSLETNASVRSRLTHTLEVANTGGLIAKQAADLLIRKGQLGEEFRLPFVEVTETCCLLHDIGNPPFGHFGESAIKKWFALNWQSIFTNIYPKCVEAISVKHINDFLHFDGNPQGIRIMLQLQSIPSDFIQYTDVGLNLTFSQVLSCMKYDANPSDVQNNRSKKAGYFFSEEQKIKKIKSALNWNYRFPITYIMEAADDISYCISDIEDGIEKGVITSKTFFDELRQSWQKPNLAKFELDDLKKGSDYDFFIFKIRLTRNLIKIASKAFVSSQKKIAANTCGDLLERDADAASVLKALKMLSRKHLFRSKEAENIELAGYKIIFGLLECFKPLLELESRNFALIIKAENNFDALKGKNLDVEWRLYNRLPKKYINAYKHAVKTETSHGEEWKEWYYRAHLIVDYISGMTDNFALETYRLLNGITV